MCPQEQPRHPCTHAYCIHTVGQRTQRVHNFTFPHETSTWQHDVAQTEGKAHCVILEWAMIPVPDGCLWQLHFRWSRPACTNFAPTFPETRLPAWFIARDSWKYWGCWDTVRSHNNAESQNPRFLRANFITHAHTQHGKWQETSE